MNNLVAMWVVMVLVTVVIWIGWIYIKVQLWLDQLYERRRVKTEKEP